jgi:hypothetical protein
MRGIIHLESRRKQLRHFHANYMAREVSTTNSSWRAEHPCVQVLRSEVWYHPRPQPDKEVRKWLWLKKSRF